MRFFWSVWFLSLLACGPSWAPGAENSNPNSTPTVVVVVGAEGTAEYGQQFQEWAGRWQKVAQRAQAECTIIGNSALGDKTDRDLLRERLAAQPAAARQPLWLVLIGHGTFDGKTARFNLRGPDLAAEELRDWLKAVERPVAVIDCTSCSGPFVAELSGRERVVIAATKSGHEYNFARFGDFVAAAIGDPQADLDKDEQTSLLEAFLTASARVREFYAREGRLTTEHALLDDNGDRLGTPADWFQGLRPTKAAKDGAALDGPLAGRFVLASSAREERLPAAVRERRDTLERELAALRQRKSKMGEVEYLALLEPVLVELARLSVQAEQGRGP